MNRVTVTLPDAVYHQLQDLANQEGVSVSHYVAYAISQQLDQINAGPPEDKSDGPAVSSDEYSIFLGMDGA